MPPPFRRRFFGGVGLAGVCLIRLADLRPLGMPQTIGLTTENAAHRVAVEWDGPDGAVPRRLYPAPVTLCRAQRSCSVAVPSQASTTEPASRCARPSGTTRSPSPAWTGLPT